MYRAYVYCSIPGHPAMRLTTDPRQTYAEANRLLTALLTQPHITGGDLERHVEGPGWCLCDHDDEKRGAA